MSEKKNLSLFERLDYVTGREEAVVAEAFGVEVWDVYDEAYPTPTEFDPDPRGSRRAGMVLHRMLVFVELVRDGEKPAKAKAAVLDKTGREVMEHFIADEDEPDPENPVTEVGKGGDATT